MISYVDLALSRLPVPLYWLRRRVSNHRLVPEAVLSEPVETHSQDRRRVLSTPNPFLREYRRLCHFTPFVFFLFNQLIFFPKGQTESFGGPNGPHNCP